MAIGYTNGWLVEKTRLPSFTITLATYYVLIGAKLGFSKLIVDQVQVGDISDANGFSFWSKVFASDWDRTEHVWNQRDKVYTVCLLLGFALIVVAIVEMQFSPQTAAFKPAGLIQFVVGVGITIAGIATLHLTEGSRATGSDRPSSPSERSSVSSATRVAIDPAGDERGSLHFTP